MADVHGRSGGRRAPRLLPRLLPRPGVAAPIVHPPVSPPTAEAFLYPFVAFDPQHYLSTRGAMGSPCYSTWLSVRLYGQGTTFQGACILARYQLPAPETPMAGLRAPDGDNDRHGTLGDSRGSTSSMESLDFFSIPKPTNEELIKLVPRKDSGYYGSETHSDKTGRGTSGMTGQKFGSSTKNLSVAVTVGGAGGDGQPLELASAEQFFNDAFRDEDYQWENGWLWAGN
ncbi:hypothetical protein BN1708_007460, partial [Verticillium longisporum]